MWPGPNRFSNVIVAIIDTGYYSLFEVHPKYTPYETRALNDLFFSYIHQNVYSEVPSKKRRKAIASKFTISYQNKDFKESNVYDVILSQIR